MAETATQFSAGTNSCRGGMLLIGDATTSRAKLLAVFYLVLTVLGGHLSTVSARATDRTSIQASKPNQSVRCGPYTVCDLASHFCDTVMNTCVRCSDDCHPGRINGDPLAEEDCKQKCKVYYELKEERARLVAMATTEKPIVNRYRSEDRSDEKQLQLSVRSLNLISTDGLTLARVELLMVVETISVAVITVLLFIISICLILLLHRQRATKVYSYSPLDAGRKTASG